MKPLKVLAAVAIAVLLIVSTLSAAGVGYVPSQSTSWYKLDNLDSAYTRYAMVMTSDPGKVGQSPNEFYLNFGDPAVRAAFELRYGPNTTGQRFKRWIGPGNEVKSIVANALSWKYGGGTPTEVEVTDAQATGDRVWHEFLMATEDGWTEARPVHFNDPTKPHGLQLDPNGNVPLNPFWGVPEYRFNDAEYVPPPPPPPPVDPPPAKLLCDPMPFEVKSTLTLIPKWKLKVLGGSKVTRLNNLVVWANSCKEDK